VVNNAGYAFVYPFEDLSMDEIKAQFETNFYGSVRVMQAVLPTMINQSQFVIDNLACKPLKKARTPINNHKSHSNP
jgi:NADP-dependent 3-hydroxy acid dehydrogenase YdfG